MQIQKSFSTSDPIDKDSLDLKGYPKLDCYYLVKTLGSGGSCKVKLGLCETDWKLYGIKIIKKDIKIESNIEQIHNEIDIMLKLNHPNI